MKIIHTSDLHIDSPLTTRLDSKKVRERKSELILTFKKMAEKAEALGASAFIIAGDLFDSERIGVRAYRNVISVISAYPKINFYYLFGNHEKEAVLAHSDTLPENLFLFGHDWTYYKEGDVNIVGKSDTDADMFKNLALNKDEKNIVILHGELRERSGEGALGKKDIEESYIDYLALGHYHTYKSERISLRTEAVYSGTPEGRGFDEAGEKGFVLIDTENMSHKFIPCAMRTLRIIDCDVTQIASDVELLYKLEELIREVPRGDLIRIKLVGTGDITHSLSCDAIYRRMKDHYFHFEIADETRVKISADDFKNDLSLKGEFIRGVLTDESLTEREKEEVIRIGLSVLLGEEEI